ncbi:ATP synthase gamma chain [Buchnera aphidicola str. Bp (Baizongia pistaciae)]|uniref:ATP synthase gamma chain n=1 Tax=Buchnera aphidicola subsp. Baizongia pistaciae (strain Bp) TaxID=224915 RepID=ATPG_BUCBP|nr:ATP synthase F1 subunit gamma [Buchnera aphidicola]Q89B40.1 RecName: Full=ATP synthase gamma chain; AltName: Full=ATP synthase F1 sector gamma subunit; AltName: Full=F-ATPase gamma subunit [Buchnera aphidicola str. Bp (Baizongia pistaciae)]AAO26751.1 ATP synthase gamma chain [Buchnera aphidicola str. Bp (Baizongia pistaciae)]
MIGIREIRSKMKSINNTKKITKAMEMVSISKLRKIKKRMCSSRPYFNIINQVISHVITGNLEHYHTYFNQRNVKRIGVIIVSTDRGLCGNLNTLLFKKVLEVLTEHINEHILNNLFVIGTKALTFFKSFTNNIVFSLSNLKNDFKIIDLMEMIRISLEMYISGKIDKLFLAYNKFNSTIIQTPTLVQLLPILKPKLGKKEVKKTWDYIYESNSKVLLNVVLNRYIEFQIYQSILENLVCEQASRMLAMKQATDNSADLLKALQMNYNKVRQSSITQELTEIISGAAAVSLN